MFIHSLKHILRGLAGTALLLGIAGHTLADRIEIQNANYNQEDDLVIVTGKLGAPGSDQLVSLLNMVTGRTLSTQVTSKKNFNFHFQPQADKGTPCAVKVVVGELSDTADVKHAPDNCSPTPLTLTGRIVDDPLPFATVTVTVGGQTFTTLADADGEYSIDIVSSLLNDLVLIEATADNPNDPGTSVDLVSLAGTFSKLLTEEPE